MERLKSDFFHLYQWYEIEEKALIGLEDKEIKTLDSLRNFINIILCGLPGNYKTSLAFNISIKLQIDLIHVMCPSFKKSQDFEQLDYHLKNVDYRAIVFFDEIDIIAPDRNNPILRVDSDNLRAIGLILNLMNHACPVLAATNAIWNLDLAIQNRFIPIYIPLPDREDRERIIRNFLKSSNDAKLSGKNVKLLAYYTNNSSRRSLIRALRDMNRKRITHTKDILKYLDENPTKFSDEDIERYYFNCKYLLRGEKNFPFKNYPGKKGHSAKQVTKSLLQQSFMN